MTPTVEGSDRASESGASRRSNAVDGGTPALPKSKESKQFRDLVGTRNPKP